MEVLEIKNMKELAQRMYHDAMSGKRTDAYLYYDSAIVLIKELLSITNVTLYHAEIWDCEWDDYEREYIVALTPEFELHIQKAWHETNEYYPAGYLYNESDVFYMDESAHSAILRRINEDCVTYEVRVCDDANEYTDELEVDADVKIECDCGCEKCDFNSELFNGLEGLIVDFVKTNELDKHESSECSCCEFAHHEEEHDNSEDRDELEIHVYFNGKELNPNHVNRGYFDIAEILNYLIG